MDKDAIYVLCLCTPRKLPSSTCYARNSMCHGTDGSHCSAVMRTKPEDLKEVESHIPVDFDECLFNDRVGASVVAQYQCSILLPSMM
jgi:hypothetical protein